MGIEKEINEICNLKPEKVFSLREEVTEVKVCYQGHYYYGSAVCSPKDMPYFSEKIGYGIASARVIRKILKEQEEKHKQIYKILHDTLNDIIRYGQKANYDRISKRINKELNKWHTFKDVRKKVDRNIQTMLVDLDKALTAIKIIQKRKKDKEN